MKVLNLRGDSEAMLQSMLVAVGPTRDIFHGVQNVYRTVKFIACYFHSDDIFLVVFLHVESLRSG